MSGVTFTCCLPDSDCGDDAVNVNVNDALGLWRSHPILNDLAGKLLEELPKHAKAANRIFINFLQAKSNSSNSSNNNSARNSDRDDDDETIVAVTPWEWERPLSDFLARSDDGTEAPPPSKRQRT
mmetsp:Transcript_10318/g.15201  ORF Transcript_10318/g.15201 Transcript_10318/m.15201 type:complete len:125 (+) Transcript_10318:202-576(+)